MKRKLFLNLLFVVLLLFVLEGVAFLATAKENSKFAKKADKVFPEHKVETKYELLSDFNPTLRGKSAIIENSDKNDILWFGCSFAIGANLNYEQTPCYKISTLTNRSCINRSKSATGLQFMYYQFQHTNFQELSPNVDFVIYTFIPDHIFRLYNVQVNPLVPEFNLRYKLVHDYPVEEKPIFRPIYSSFLVKKLLDFYSLQKVRKEFGDYKLFNRLIKGTFYQIKNIYPNAKFIIVRFPTLVDIEELEPYIKKELSTLNKTGIEVFDAKTFLNEQGIDYNNSIYWTEDKIHPSDKLWDIILPEIVKKYSM